MKILFFLPYGGRTGSEIVLYNLICNADRRKMKMAVTCPGDGPLLKAFPPDVPTFTHANEEAIKLIHEQVRPDAWYVNTITQLDLLQLGRNLDVPCVLHTHELEQMLFDLTPEAAEEMVSSPQLVIASSEAAADMMRALGRKKGMEVSHSSIDVAKARSQPGASAQIKTALGIKKDDFVWVMSGTLDPNKNPVRFVEIAHALLQKRPRAHFIWIGGSENAYSRFTKARAKTLGVDEQVTWIPALAENYYNYLDVANGFVLTSNRDCFPLVMIEIAALGKPLVSFDSGGVREFFRPGMGVLIRDSWNVSDIAAAMIQVMDKKVNFDGSVSRKRAAEFDVSSQVKHWQSLLKRHLKTFLGKRDEAGGSSRTNTLKGQLDQVRQELLSKSEALTRRDGEIERSREELVLAKRQVAATEAALDLARKELLSLKEEISFQTSALEDASKLAVSLQDELNLKGDQIDDAGRELSATTHELARVAGELAVLKRRLLDQQSVIDDFRKQPFWRALNLLPSLQRFVKGKPAASQHEDDPALPKEGEGHTFWLEHPTAPSRAGERVMVSGWVVTPSGERIEGVEAVAHGEKVAGVHGLERADVGAAHQERSDYLHSGFAIDLKLPAGSHQVALRYLTRGHDWNTFCSFQHDVHAPEAPG